MIGNINDTNEITFKKESFNIIILLLVFSFSFSQELTVTYFDQFVFPESVKVRNEYHANLLFDNGKSIYFPANKVENFNEVNTSIEYETKTIDKKVVHKFSTINFKNNSENLQVTEISQGGNKYLITEELQFFEWTITDKEKKIGDYVCKLAIAKSKGVEIEAWFTEEIPVASGPAEYGGLPGLILEVKKGIKHILAKKITFTTEKELIKPPIEGIVVTRKEYNVLVTPPKEKDVTETNVESIAGGTKTTMTRTVIKKNQYKNKSYN